MVQFEESYRYRLILSDGQYMNRYAMLTSRLNNYKTEGKLFNIMQSFVLTGFIISSMFVLARKRESVRERRFVLLFCKYVRISARARVLRMCRYLFVLLDQSVQRVASIRLEFRMCPHFWNDFGSLWKLEDMIYYCKRTCVIQSNSYRSRQRSTLKFV